MFKNRNNKMFTKYNEVFLFSTIIIFNLHQTNSNAISNVPSSSIENSSLRKGLQFMYSTANNFIDAIKITLPNEIFPSNASTFTVEDLKNNINNYFQSKDSTVYFNKVVEFLFFQPFI